jgi:indole-3-glycerol phosphate synthase
MLEWIVADTRRRLPDVLARRASIEDAVAAAEATRDFAGALANPGLSVIAEFKRASPSRGPLNLDMEPATQAAVYEQGGASAMSILTEPDHFFGSGDDLIAARAATSLPVIRKDFTLDPVHVWEARAMGADAVLLIVAILAPTELSTLIAASREVGLEALVEVHNAEEARVAVDSGAAIVGVNNRDLTTFDVDIATAEEIAPLLADITVRVAESGILGPPDATRMRVAGYDAVLVGEYLVKAGDPAAAIAGLRSA